MHSVKGLDLFKKLPTDHFPQTATGGLFTLLALVTMCSLFLLELNSYLSPTIVKDTFVDIARADQIQVNINVTLPNIPCGMVGMDLQDSVGGHSMDLGNALKKAQITVNGALKANQQLDTSVQGIRNALNDGEYCRVEGNFKVGSLPGNFHLSFHSQHALVHQLFHPEVRKMRFEHTLSHLSFGTDLHSLMSDEEEHEIFAPYDNLQVTLEPDGQVYNVEYFIKIMPMQFYDESTGVLHSSYQYSMSHKSQVTNSAFGAIYFRYDVDSITVKYTRKSGRLAHFLINVCAILGGVFAVIGIFHSMAQQLLRSIKG